MNRVVTSIIKWLGIGLLGVTLGASLAYVTRPEPPEVGVEGAGVGVPHPPLVHARLDGHMAGERVSLEAYAGQPILINFWATWCAPCRREMPLLQATHEAYADQLVVLGVAMDTPEAVGKFVADLGISYPIWVGEMDVSASQARWGNPSGALPYTVLVDDQGVIRWQHLGEVSQADLEDALALIF